jgi:nucleoside-diphosphate-sugar epimerase
VKILIIGGTKFIGPAVVNHLCEMGHEVTVFHRGLTRTDLPNGINQILGDRSNLKDYRNEFSQLAPDVVLDMIPFSEQDAKVLMDTFKGIVGRIVALSSGDVYHAYDIR